MSSIRHNALAIAVLAALAAAGSVEARGVPRTVEVMKSGAIRILPGQAFGKAGETTCDANPGLAFRYVEVPGGAADHRVDEDAGTVSATFDVTIDAMCLPGSTTVRFNYGVVPGGTATLGSDYTIGSPNPASVTFTNLPQFGPAVSSTTSLAITIIDDADFEPDETIPTGGLGGAFVNNDPDGFVFASPITSSGTALATLTIDDNDDLTNIGALADEIIADDPVAGPIAGALTPICNAPGQDAALIEQCRAIRQGIADGDVEGVRAALRAIAPEEVLTQNAVGLELAGVQLDGIGQRLSALHAVRETRRRGGGFALNFDLGGVPVSGLLQPLLSRAAAEDGIGGGLIASPWGIFANVSVGQGDRDRTARASGFDHDRSDVTVGVDYRIDDRFIVGGAAGYSTLSADLDAGGGEVDSDGWSLLAFGSYTHPQGIFVDAVVSFSRLDFDSRRRVAFSTGGVALDRVASSETDADQFGLDLSVGRAFNHDAWVFTPQGSLRYQATTIDAFRETGAGEFDLAIDEQDLDSLIAGVSIHVARNFSTDKGILIPYAQLGYNLETQNGADSIGARLIADVSQTRFVVTGDSRDSSFGDLSLGLTFVAAGGFQGYIAYSQVFGLEFFDDQSITVGGRWEF